MCKITKENIYNLSNPGQFTLDEWRASIECYYRMTLLGNSASMSGAEYASAEAIKYISEQFLKQQ